ncbi:PadR family transcriptional regulator [Corynebacterium striatum]
MSMKHSLLSLLSARPATASQLQHEFADVMEGLWPLNIGQVSQTLKRLERDNFIAESGEVTGPTGRKAVEYSITEEGRSELAAWWTRSVGKQPIERDELVLKIALAASRSDVDALKILDTQRFATMKQLRILNQQASEMPEERSARRLALEREIFDLEALSRWLDRAESLATPTSLSPTTKPEED